MDIEYRGETYHLEPSVFEPLTTENPDGPTHEPSTLSDENNNTVQEEDESQRPIVVELHVEEDPLRHVFPYSFGNACLAICLITILFVDLGCSIYLRVTISPEIMRVANHPTWSSESKFLLIHPILTLCIITYLTVNMFLEKKMHYTFFVYHITGLVIAATANFLWLISENQDKQIAARYVSFHEPNPTHSDLMESRVSHRSVIVLLQLKVFETILIVLVALIWLRDWNEYNHSFTWTARRRVPPPLPIEVNRSSTSTSRMPYSVTIPQEMYGMEPSNHGFEPPPSDSNNGKGGGGGATDANQMEISKTAQNEFREKGDGNGVGAAVPRIIT